MPTGRQINKPPEHDDAESSSVGTQFRRFLIGKPRDLRDRSVFHSITLIPFLAWVGMGADGLSSSSYGPAEAFLALGNHTYLAVALAAMTAFTVLIISVGYSRIIEMFPHGGGGYVVATKLLGERVGVISGCALLVDYVLTITVSLVAAGDAVFSFIPPNYHHWKLFVVAAAILLLIILNLRGVRESVLILTPIFVLFLITHATLLIVAVGSHLSDLPELANRVTTGFQAGHSQLGVWGMLLLLLHAYSLGGGTYTGIEAVSNGLPLLREPKVQTGKRTMLYMAISLAITASGLLLCYLLVNAKSVEGKTLNAVVIEHVGRMLPMSGLFIFATIAAEGMLLFVAAQTGFIDGPRVLANMAVDSWAPRKFSALSERLTTQNGILLMGGASLLALYFTGGNVHTLIIMYSINVFLTFTLSMLGMLLAHSRQPKATPRRRRGIALFFCGLVLCATILVITVMEKFTVGGWVTLITTGTLIAVCYVIRRHYNSVSKYLKELDAILDTVPDPGDRELPEFDPQKPTAAILVGGYGGLGIHTILNIFKAFPGYYQNLAFISVGVIDSGRFKGEQEVKALKAATRESLERYIELSRRLGIPATYRWTIGTDAVAEAEQLCLEFRKECPKTNFFAGQVIFHLESWYHRWLHNQTAFAVQKRLQLDGIGMFILPVRVKGPAKRADRAKPAKKNGA